MLPNKDMNPNFIFRITFRKMEKPPIFILPIIHQLNVFILKESLGKQAHYALIINTLR